MINLKRIVSLVIVLAFILAIPVFAESRSNKAAAKATPGEFDYYVFSLSWEPAFCSTHQDKKECTSLTPDKFDAKNLVLHGLWPNKKSDKNHSYGYCNVKSSIKKLDKPETWCKMPDIGLSEETKSDLAIFMPGSDSCLENHEWYKHGTCSNMDSNQYFSTAVDLVKKASETNFNKFISDNAGNSVKRNDLLAAVEKDFGEGKSGYVNLYCDNSQQDEVLVEVRLYFANPIPSGSLSEMVIKPEGSEKGNCSQEFLISGVVSQAAVEESATLVAKKKSSPALPQPLIAEGLPVDWWFVFKFNSATFPECDGAERKCIFGGKVNEKYGNKYSQQYVYASSQEPTLQKGSGCVGDTLTDPVGATFNQVYNDGLYYVIWNDQFYQDPKITGCGDSCSSPWGHSKGIVVWNDNGDGFVMQVTTPSWPAAGNKSNPRQTDGNTLGCIKDNNVKVNQHFFALKLNKGDLNKLLLSLQNASVVTDISNPQIGATPTFVQPGANRLK